MISFETLQRLQVDPSVPVFGFIGRLEEQKGVDILIQALSQIGEQGGIQVVVLGTGKKVLEEAVLKLDQQFPETVKGVVKFDVPLAHLMTAGKKIKIKISLLQLSFPILEKSGQQELPKFTVGHCESCSPDFCRW